MTTAQLRNKAREHEQALEWVEAAKCWLAAVEAYPASHAGSELVKIDIEKMKQRAKNCQAMVA